MSEHNELKPCPFCGGEAKIAEKNECGGFGCYSTVVYVACKECKARGTKVDSHFHGNDEKHLKALAILCWNGRTDDGKRTDN